MVPEVFEEVNKNLLLDVMWLHTVCHTALFYHLGEEEEGRRGEKEKRLEKEEGAGRREGHLKFNYSVLPPHSWWPGTHLSLPTSPTSPWQNTYGLVYTLSSHLQHNFLHFFVRALKLSDEDDHHFTCVVVS